MTAAAVTLLGDTGDVVDIAEAISDLVPLGVGAHGCTETHLTFQDVQRTGNATEGASGGGDASGCSMTTVECLGHGVGAEGLLETGGK
ncbi:hypothetical protein D9M71_607060 [compost metagenome]